MQGKLQNILRQRSGTAQLPGKGERSGYLRSRTSERPIR